MTQAQVYCQQCDKRRDLGLITTQTSEGETPWGDIVCPVCHFVISTITTETPGTYVLTRAAPDASVRELASEAALRICDEMLWDQNDSEKVADIIAKVFADVVRQARPNHFLDAINIADGVLDKYEERYELSPLMRQHMKGLMIHPISEALEAAAIRAEKEKDAANM